MNRCIVLPVKNAVDEKESIKINHGFEVIHSCSTRIYITGVTGLYQKQVTTKCENLGKCESVYEANYFIPNPIANWRMKDGFNLSTPNGSVITYVGEKTFCEQIISGKYLGTRIIRRKIIVSNRDMEVRNTDGVLISKEDISLGLFEAKKYVMENIEFSTFPIFTGSGEATDYLNNTKTTETSKIAYDENPALMDFREIVRNLINALIN